MSLNDHELTVLVEAAACGAVNSRAAHHGGSDWDHLDAADKNAVREHALPFVFHGTRALEDLGFTKPRTVVTVAELDALPDMSAVLDDMDGPLTRFDSWWRAADGAQFHSMDVVLPATVLWEPQP